MGVYYQLIVRIDGQSAATIQTRPETVALGSYSVGDDYFLNTTRFSINRVGHRFVPAGNDFTLQTFLEIKPSAGTKLSSELESPVFNAGGTGPIVPWPW